MRRLCFLCADIERARSTVTALRRAGIADSHIMVVARHDVQLEGLPAAGIAKTDAIPGLERGLAAGGMIGAIAGIVALSFEEIGVALGGAAIPLFALFGAGVGGLAALLAGASLSSTRLRSFEQAIEQQGKILLMVDVEKDTAEQIERLVRTESPEVELMGFEPRAPIIPR
jgi:hypothetical protein